MIDVAAMTALVDATDFSLLGWRFSKDLFGHYKCCESVGEGVDACTVICGGKSIRPHDVES